MTGDNKLTIDSVTAAHSTQQPQVLQAGVGHTCIELSFPRFCDPSTLMHFDCWAAAAADGIQSAAMLAALLSLQVPALMKANVVTAHQWIVPVAKQSIAVSAVAITATFHPLPRHMCALGRAAFTVLPCPPFNRTHEASTEQRI
jgi:hypothetical protein